MSLKIKTLIGLLVFMVVTPSVLMASGGNSATLVVGDINSSAVDRELWWNPHWHNRFFINVAGDNDMLEAGTPVEYQLGLLTGVVLDVNSLRVVYKGLDVPSQYVMATNTLIFSVQEDIANGSSTKYTVYFDDLSNGIKTADDYGIAWAEDLILNAGSGFQSNYTAERDLYILNNNVSQVNETYYYQNEVVHYNNITDKWYYDNGSGVLGIVWQVNNTWYLQDNETVVELTTGGERQTVFLDGFYDGVGLAAISNDSFDMQSAEVGAVRADYTGLGEYNNSGGQMVEATVTGTGYRDYPIVRYGVDSNISTSENAWASGLINLNGTVTVNNTILDKYNISDWVENATGANMTEFGNQTEEALKGAGNIRIMTEQENVAINNIVWDDSETYVVATDSVDYLNLSGRYGKTYAAGDEVRVKPYSLRSRYLALYDIITQEGFALVFEEWMAFSNIVLQIYQEKLADGTINYYLEIGLNYLDWAEELIAEYGPSTIEAAEAVLANLGSIHLPQVGDFGFITGLFKSLNPTFKLNRLITPALPALVNGFLRDESLPLGLKIHSPFRGQRFKRLEDIFINVTVTGETLMDIWYHWGKEQNVKFHGTVQFWEDVPVTGHFATEGILNGSGAGEQILLPEGKGDVNLTITAVDTNTQFIMETIPIHIEDPWASFGFTAGLVGMGVGIGIVAVYGFQWFTKKSKSAPRRKISGSKSSSKGKKKKDGSCPPTGSQRKRASPSKPARRSPAKRQSPRRASVSRR